MKLIPYFISMILGMSLLSTAFAEKQDHDAELDNEHRYHGVHVHGMATLDLVMDGEILMLQLQSPLMNFLGFEHQPQTEQQKAIYQDMREQFKIVGTILEIEGTSCVAESIEVNDPYAAKDKTQHADIDVSYFLRCDQPENITGLEVNLFDVYNRLEALQVQMVLPTGQQQLKLNPQRTTIRVN